MRNRDALRHWHGHSEPYTGGDSLATALRNGWEITEAVIQARTVRGNRSVTVCHFTLCRDRETVVMTVLANPFIFRLIADAAFPVVMARGG
jgi:hypothetical protein